MSGEYQLNMIDFVITLLNLNFVYVGIVLYLGYVNFSTRDGEEIVWRYPFPAVHSVHRKNSQTLYAPCLENGSQ